MSKLAPAGGAFPALPMVSHANARHQITDADVSSPEAVTLQDRTPDATDSALVYIIRSIGIQSFEHQQQLEMSPDSWISWLAPAEPV